MIRTRRTNRGICVEGMMSEMKPCPFSVETLYTQVNWVFHEIVPKTIDNLMKEMTEGKDGNV